MRDSSTTSRVVRGATRLGPAGGAKLGRLASYRLGRAGGGGREAQNFLDSPGPSMAVSAAYPYGALYECTFIRAGLAGGRGMPGGRTRVARCKGRYVSLSNLIAKPRGVKLRRARLDLTSCSCDDESQGGKVH